MTCGACSFSNGKHDLDCPMQPGEACPPPKPAPKPRDETHVQRTERFTHLNAQAAGPLADIRAWYAGLSPEDQGVIVEDGRKHCVSQAIWLQALTDDVPNHLMLCILRRHPEILRRF